MDVKSKKRALNEMDDTENSENEEGEKKKTKMKSLKEEQISELLVCGFEMQLYESDKLFSNKKICIEKVDDAFPISSTCFPSILKIHTTGSRAEKLWHQFSDTDILYEIGPGLVCQKNNNRPTTQTTEKDQTYSETTLTKEPLANDPGCFFWEETDHVGHYRIYDSKGGGYLYPKDLQMKLAPTFTYLENNKQSSATEQNETNQAAVTLNDNNTNNVRSDGNHLWCGGNNVWPGWNNVRPGWNHSWRGGNNVRPDWENIQIGGNKDHIIGLKLDKWPESIKNDLVLKLGVQAVEKLIGKKYLFLVQM